MAAGVSRRCDEHGPTSACPPPPSASGQRSAGDDLTPSVPLRDHRSGPPARRRRGGPRRAGHRHLPALQRRLRDSTRERAGRLRAVHDPAAAGAGAEPEQRHDLRRRPDLALDPLGADQGRADGRADGRRRRPARRAGEPRVRLRPGHRGGAVQGVALPVARHQHPGPGRQGDAGPRRPHGHGGGRREARLHGPADARDRAPVLARPGRALRRPGDHGRGGRLPPARDGGRPRGGAHAPGFRGRPRARGQGEGGRHRARRARPRPDDNLRGRQADREGGLGPALPGGGRRHGRPGEGQGREGERRLAAGLALRVRPRAWRPTPRSRRSSPSGSPGSGRSWGRWWGRPRSSSTRGARPCAGRRATSPTSWRTPCGRRPARRPRS